MKSFVALLRGINVGGNNKVKMSDLSDLFLQLGYKDVSTYLNSGNVLFKSDESSNEKHQKQIEETITKKLGLTIRVIIKDKEELEKAFANNPFKKETIESDRTLFVSFLFNELPKESQSALRELSNPAELIEPSNHEIYTLLVRAHFPKSHMSKNTLFRKLATDSTTRNWNTLTNLIERM